MTEENEQQPEKLQQVSIEQAIQMYEAKIQEQTNLLFALVAQMGGSVNITQEIFDQNTDYNTITAQSNEDGSVTLALGFEERPEAEDE